MRLRVQYSIASDLRFLSNLDRMHLVERALRRAEIPYFLSEGFNPHIRLSMGTVLPVGLWGLEEYFDLELEDMEPAVFNERMNRVLPPAMRITRSKIITKDLPALMKSIDVAAYTFCLQGVDEAMLDDVKSRLINSSSLPVQSRGKKKDKVKDLRLGIYAIDSSQQEDGYQLTFWVSIGEPLNVRYDELLDLLEQNSLPGNFVVDYFRKGNYIKKVDGFYSPIEVM